MCNNLNKFALFKKCLYSCHPLVIRSCQSSILIEIIYIYVYSDGQFDLLRKLCSLDYYFFFLPLLFKRTHLKIIYLVVICVLFLYTLLLLLLLSRFSRVRLCATPQTAAHQAPSFLGFSRQEHWSGLPLPSPMHESEK